MVRLSIVIPAYNEEKRILKTLQQYTAFFTKTLKRDYELFVVINGCTDNTFGVVGTFAAKHSTVKYKDIGKVQGKGAALLEGFTLVKGDLIGFVDADCATPPRAFNDLYRRIGLADGIIASRWTHGAVISPPQPLLRRIASRCFNILVRVLFLLPHNDTQTGAKLFKKKPLKTVLPKLGITQWAFDIDLLYLLKKNGFSVKEIPTEWHDDPDSHLRIGKASWEMFLSIVRLRLIYSPFSFIVDIYNTIATKLWRHQ